MLSVFFDLGNIMGGFEGSGVGPRGLGRRINLPIGPKVVPFGDYLMEF